jgi:hypothetical protein
MTGGQSVKLVDSAQGGFRPLVSFFLQEFCQALTVKTRENLRESSHGDAGWLRKTEPTVKLALFFISSTEQKT